MNKNRTTTLLTIFLLSNLISFALIGQTLIIPEEEIFIEEFSRSETPQVRLPNRNGGFEFFETVRSDIFEEGFARKFPSIESYKVFSKKSGIFGRIISVENSIHAFLFDGKGYYAIEKNLQGDYILSDKDRRHPDDKFICSGEIEPEELEEELKEQSHHFRGPEDLRVFRIAVASSGEFTKGRFGQSSVSQVQAVIAARIMALNVMYENELSVHFSLIPNNDQLTYFNEVTDGFDPDDRTSSAHDVINAAIGAANYDIGHVFYEIPNNNYGSSGVAILGSLCKDWWKGGGWTGVGGEASFYTFMGTFAHEVGHQLGAHHSYYGTDENCVNRSAGHGYEPGSGNTLMSYEGSCGSHNILPEVNTLFIHVHNLIEMDTYLNGVSCGNSVATGNTAPVVTVPDDKSIPRSTPFEIMGSATDADDEILYYDWEQYDTDNLELEFPDGYPGVAGMSSTAPLFRTFDPSPEGYYRSFPKLEDILNDEQSLGEALPRRERDIHLRLVVRDKHAGDNGNADTGGAYSYAETVLSVSNNSGPFELTSQNTSTEWDADGSSMAEITWDVANTDLAPVSCSHVDILFSVDGGKSFPYTLVENTPNDGSESILVPNLRTYIGRIKIKAHDNYFFDINNADIVVNSDCLANGHTFSSDETISKDQFSPELNLDLEPDFGNLITEINGTITDQDPASWVAANQFNDCADFTGNPNHFDVYEVYVPAPENYTFTIDGPHGLVMNMYENSFFPTSPCINWLSSNLTHTGFFFPIILPLLQPGKKYELTVSSFSPATPSLPASYSVTTDMDIYDGIPSPGPDYSYAYVIVNYITNSIIDIVENADLSSYPGGEYIIYGLSYLAADLPNMDAYNGQDFSELKNDVLQFALCGNLSVNSKLVFIEGQSCSITSSGLNVMACNNQNTSMDLLDDTFSFSLDPQGNDLSGSYDITGAVELSDIPYGQERTIVDMLPADGALHLLRIQDSQYGCFLDIEIQAPDHCSTECTIESANINISGCQDDFTIEIEPNGINLTSSFSLTGDLVQSNLDYVNSHIIGQNLDAANGPFTFTISDDLHQCSLEITENGPQSKPEIINTIITASDCIDDTGILQLEVEGGTEPYQFDLGEGYQDNPVFNELAPGSYSLSVLDALDCEIIQTVIIPSEDGPEVELGPDQDICFGEIITLNAGNDGTTYQWTLNGEILAGETASTMDANVSGTYGVTSTNEFQCSTTDFMVLTVHDLPEIDLGTDIEACEGDEVTIGDPTSGLDFSWTLNGTPISNTDNFITVETAGVYEATVSNAFDCFASDQITISFLPKPVINLVALVGACEGTPIELDPRLNENDFSFIWTLDGEQISTSNKIIVLEAGIYELTAYNSACSESDEVEVFFNHFPDVSIEFDEYQICQGEEVILKGSVDGGIYNWYYNGNPVPGGENNPEITVSEPGIYLLEAINISCISAAEAEVIVHDLPAIDVDDEIVLCPDEMIDYFPGTYTGYLWHDGSVADHLSLINNLNEVTESTVNYSVTVTDDNGCQNSDGGLIRYLPIIQGAVHAEKNSICYGETVQLTASGGDMYEWTGGAGSLSATDISSPVASPTETTAYSVTISEERCPNNFEILSMTISVHPIADVSAGVDTCIFIGQSIELNATGGNSYEWTDPNGFLSSVFGNNPLASPSQTTTFSVEITDQNGCTYYDEVEICIIDDPDFIIPATSIITPNDDGKNDALRFKGLESFGENQIKIFTRWGEEIFSATNYQKNGALWDGTKFGESLPAGVYFYVLTFGEYTIKSSVTLVR